MRRDLFRGRNDNTRFRVPIFWYTRILFLKVMKKELEAVGYSHEAEIEDLEWWLLSLSIRFGEHNSRWRRHVGADICISSKEADTGTPFKS